MQNVYYLLQTTVCKDVYDVSFLDAWRLSLLEDNYSMFISWLVHVLVWVEMQSRQHNINNNQAAPPEYQTSTSLQLNYLHTIYTVAIAWIFRHPVHKQ